MPRCSSSIQHIRVYATKHLGALIQNSTRANSWMLRLLLTQLYDPAPEVCELAVQYLRQACEDRDVLQLVVEMQPTLDHLGDVGHPLLLKFMSTPIGFQYLCDAGYIVQEMEGWFHVSILIAWTQPFAHTASQERNRQYAVQVEVYLARAFNLAESDEDDEQLTFEGTVPAHFYGEMAKTELGCTVLQEKGHFNDFADFIRLHGLEHEDVEIIDKLKSVLWAVVSQVFCIAMMLLTRTVGQYCCDTAGVAVPRGAGNYPNHFGHCGAKSRLICPRVRSVHRSPALMLTTVKDLLFRTGSDLVDTPRR